MITRQELKNLEKKVWKYVRSSSGSEGTFWIGFIENLQLADAFLARRELDGLVGKETDNTEDCCGSPNNCCGAEKEMD